MRISKNVLNNMMMENQRRNPLYQTIITDLAITGNIDRDDAEMLLGYEIPNYLKTPDGQTIDEDDDSEDETPVKKPETNAAGQKQAAKKDEE